MKKAPMIYTLEGLFKTIQNDQAEINGKWVPARPEGFYSIWYRLEAAWLVFTGKAEVVKWPGGQ